MIPVLVGLGIAAVGAAILSDDDSKKKNDAPVTSKRNVSESYVEQKIQQSGRKIKIVGNSQANLSTFERVKIIIEEQLDTNKITWNSRFVEDLGANFQDMGIIINLLENRFKVNLRDKKFKTVGDVVTIIDSM